MKKVASYSCLTRNVFRNGKWSLIPLREEDLMDIMYWRNAQMDVLRQSQPISAEQQMAYYREKIIPCFTSAKPSQILFSYLEDDICIGYGGLTNIDWLSEKTELSFLLNPAHTKSDDRYQLLFRQFLILAGQVVFEEMDFNRIFTETYNIRPLHIRVLEEEGFVREGRMREHVMVQGKRTDSLIHGFLKSSYGKIQK